MPAPAKGFGAFGTNKAGGSPFGAKTAGGGGLFGAKAPGIPFGARPHNIDYNPTRWP